MTSLLESLSLFPQILERVNAFSKAAAPDKRGLVEALQNEVDSAEHKLREDLRNNYASTLTQNCELQRLTLKANALLDREKEPLNIHQTRKWNGDTKKVVEELERQKRACEECYVEHYALDGRFQALKLVRLHVRALIHKNGLDGLVQAA